MEDFCTACLCKGRKMQFLCDTQYLNVFSQILNEASIYNINIYSMKICWECRAGLRKVELFKEKVVQAQGHLANYQLQKDSSKCMTILSSLKTETVFNISTNNEDVKVENDSVITFDENITDLQLEVDVKIEEHTEPITFVNNLEFKREKKKNTKKPSKTVKDKSKKKIKVLKKVKEKLKELDVNNDFNDSEVNDEYLPDNDNDEDDVKLEEIKLKKNENNKTPNKVKTKKKLKVLKKVKDKLDLNNDVNDYEANEEYLPDNDNDEDDVKLEDINLKNNENKVVNKSKEKSKSKEEPLPEKPFCVECGKQFSSKKTYRYHMNVLHQGQNRYPCPRCGKVYQWKSNLGRHMRTHKALDSGELYCALCDKRFASVATHTQHLRVSRRHVAESEFTFMCNECGKKFVNKTRLRDHIDWEHLHKIKFKCQLCNKAFKCHTSLYVHLQNVHTNKHLKNNLCHVCGKSYQNAAKLKYHIIAMHTNETPYSCDQCDTSFGWYSSLYRHVREVHHKVKFFQKQKKKLKKIDVNVLPQQLIQGPS